MGGMATPATLATFPASRVGAIDREGRPYDRADPARYGTSVTRPEGYDAFWQETWDRLQRIPLEPEVEPVPLRSTPEIAVYEGHYTSWEGLRIACWYCVPRAVGRGRDGRHPAIAFMPGYVSEPPLGIGKEWARAGFACVVVAPRVRCPTLVNIGLVDPTCPPETGYAVFDAIGAAEKELCAYPGEGHSAGRAEHSPKIEAWMRRHLGVPHD